MKTLKARIKETKDLFLKNLKEKFPRKKRSQIRVGITFGAFDLCHAGHMLMFEEGRGQCDYFIVGIDVDPSRTSKSYRGKKKHKPVMSVSERQTILAGIRHIDQTFVYYKESEVRDFLSGLSPDVRIIGADWRGKKPTGWDLPIEMFYNSRSHTFSTTELIRRIQDTKLPKNGKK